MQFNKCACERMDLKAGDKITLAQDEESPENWYFFKDRNGFEIRSGYKGQSMMFNHRTLVKTFLGAFGKDEEVTHKFFIAGEATTMKGDKAGTQYWGILVS